MTEYVGTADAGTGFIRSLQHSTATVRGARELTQPRRGGRAAILAWYQRRAVISDVSWATLTTIMVVLTVGPSEPGWSAIEPLVLGPMWITLLIANQVYNSRHTGEGSEEYRVIARSGAHLVSIVAVWCLLVGQQPNLQVLLPALGGLIATSMVARKVLRTRYYQRRLAGKNLQRVVVVGQASAARDLVAAISSNPVGTGLEVVAVCTEPDDVVRPSEFDGVPVHGNPHTALHAAERYEAGAVAIASHPDLVGHSLRRLSWALEARGIDLMVDPGIVEVAGPRLSLRPAAGMSLLHVERPVANEFAYRVKVFIERCLAILALVLLSPLFAVVATCIKRESPGPVFFTQERIGAAGQPFRMVKFRSMVNGADAKKAELAGGFDQNATLFKLKDDPRVTKSGRWLRKFSIDELPQLINVARGEMSLIGPRPPLASEVASYDSDAFRRLRLLPGMTGLWQVNGRSDLSWEESLRYDLWYVDNWSVTVDLQILVRTVRAVLRGDGAY